jgi:hypothetical protein
MICPHCKETIDDDSDRCDQCGQEVFVCAECGRPGTGKRCTFDGKEMIKPSGRAAGVVPAPQQGAIPPPSPQTFAPQMSALETLTLTCAVKNITITPSGGDIIGRKTGQYVNIFGSNNFVSGTHLQIIQTSGGWQVMDLGSTNGTKYNGQPLAPNVPCPIADGGTINIADEMEFAVSITGQADSGATNKKVT